MTRFTEIRKAGFFTVIKGTTVFCGEHLLCSYLRPSNIDAARHSRAILKLLVQRIRQRWPATRIMIRGDSGFLRSGAGSQKGSRTKNSPRLIPTSRSFAGSAQCSSIPADPHPIGNSPTPRSVKKGALCPEPTSRPALARPNKNEPLPPQRMKYSGLRQESRAP